MWGVREPSIHRGNRCKTITKTDALPYGSFWKEKQLKWLLTNACICFNHGNCLDAHPQRAKSPVNTAFSGLFYIIYFRCYNPFSTQKVIYNVYNLHFSLVKIYNTIKPKNTILTPIWLPLNYFTKTDALLYGSFWEEKHMEWLLMIALAIILITEYVWTRRPFDSHWYFLYNWNR